MWFFVVLYHKKYGVSAAYDATNAQSLQQIIGILQQVKQYFN
jgi:hypothetical protein